MLELLHFDREGNDPQRDRSFTEPGLTHLSFSVDDVPATCHLVTQHGGEVLSDTDVGGFAIMVRDPDGQLLELLPMSYRTGCEPVQVGSEIGDYCRSSDPSSEGPTNSVRNRGLPPEFGPKSGRTDQPGSEVGGG